MKIAILSGEHSGDILGASLMNALQQYDPNIQFIGVPGPKMRALGCEALFAMEDIAVMGIVEIVQQLPRLLALRKQLVAQLIALQPDVVIGIDAPDFNLTVELRLKAAGLTTVHYVSPSVWAWRQKRIYKIAKATDLVLSLLPFEKDFYDQYQVPCHYVGHSLADEIPLVVNRQQAQQQLGLSDHPTLAILPGSRRAEIESLAIPFLQAAIALQQKIPNLQVVVALVNHEREQLWQQLISPLSHSLKLITVVDNSQQVMTASHAVLLASGTASLEAMLLKCPMVVAYKLHWLTYAIAKRMVKLQYFSLPNLLANEALVPELLQEQVTTPQLVNALLPLLQDDQSSLIARFTQYHQQLRRQAGQQAAQAIMTLVQERQC